MSLPLVQFLLLRWYFRLFIWVRFLCQVSRLELTLVPPHPERSGGLGFLGLAGDAWWRLSLLVPISENLETHYREGNLILQCDYAFGQSNRMRSVRLLDEGRAGRMKTFLARGGYLGGQSLDDEGQTYSEHMILAELHLRTPLKRGMILSSRLRADLRWLGDTPEFSTRWRFRASAVRGDWRPWPRPTAPVYSNIGGLGIASPRTR